MPAAFALSLPRPILLANTCLWHEPWQKGKPFLMHKHRKMSLLQPHHNSTCLPRSLRLLKAGNVDLFCPFYRHLFEPVSQRLVAHPIVAAMLAKPSLHNSANMQKLGTSAPRCVPPASINAPQAAPARVGPLGRRNTGKGESEVAAH